MKVEHRDRIRALIRRDRREFAFISAVRLVGIQGKEATAPQQRLLILRSAAQMGWTESLSPTHSPYHLRWMCFLLVSRWSWQVDMGYLPVAQLAMWLRFHPWPWNFPMPWPCSFKKKKRNVVVDSLPPSGFLGGEVGYQAYLHCWCTVCSRPGSVGLFFDPWHSFSVPRSCVFALLIRAHLSPVPPAAPHTWLSRPYVQNSCDNFVITPGLQTLSCPVHAGGSWIIE